jgi:hypothetical protein
VLSLRAAGTLLAGAENLVGGEYIRASGTSMAAPHVAGAAALVRSAHPAESAADVAGRLAAGAEPSTVTTRRFAGTRLAFGQGRLDLLGPLMVEPRPHLVVTGIDLDTHPGQGGNADGEAAGGERVPLILTLRNAWRPAAGVTLRLAAEGPFVAALGGSFTVAPWPGGALRTLSFACSVHPATPRDHLARLRLEVEADGWRQSIPLHFVVNPPPTLAVVPNRLRDIFAFNPDAAADAGGNFVVAWRRYVLSADQDANYVQRFDALGRALSEAVRADEALPGSISFPAVASAPSGEFVVTWVRAEGLGSGEPRRFVEARRFSAAGAPSGPVFTVSQQPGWAHALPNAAVDPAGGFVVVWHAGDPDAGTQRVLARRFGGDGVPRGDTFPVGAGEHQFESFSGVGMRPDGWFFVAWNAYPTLQGFLLRGRLFGTDGEPRGPVLQLSDGGEGTFSSPKVAIGPAGEVLVAWAPCEALGLCRASRVKARRLSADGQPVGAVMELVPPEPVYIEASEPVFDRQGGFALAWSECLVTGFFLDSCDLRLAHFAADGARRGATSDLDLIDALLTPSLLRSPRGYALVYEEVGSFPDGIFVRLFDDPVPEDPCDPVDPLNLCLAGDRFRLAVEWRDHQGRTGQGRAVPLREDSGAFWFFRDDNLELLAKVLDGRAINGQFWFFYGALSDVEYAITVQDTATGAVRRYANPRGRLASFADTGALPAPPPPAAPAHASAAPPGSGLRRAGPAGGGAARPADVGASSSATVGIRLRHPGKPGSGESPSSSGEIAVPSPLSAGAGCSPTPATLCVAGGRFSVTVAWRTPQGATGAGAALAAGDRTGLFWFFREDNLELVVKALDGSGINGHWWFFYGALSDVEYTITVTDTVTGAVRTYHNPPGQMASRADTEAF